MLRIAIVANLVAYSIVVSQPLAYLFFLGKAQRALSAAAYIELRQSINSVMTKRVPVVYPIALVALLLQLALSWRAADWSRFAAAAIALVCLVVDVLLALRANVPINEAMDRWTTTAYPADWEQHRAGWFRAFAYRQTVALFGFAALLAGAVG